ncbi:hypothetical protein BDY19DRAFT_995626 [Irpex rosettiformis]|uniref:Uncharacterized protein n=1 Tax=Irpex rosettiformis TaxID=378272 RepID=A0ACB8TX02_9APHY|nr:hypothetical protein BDY19DRAFT_995626 [Irpex rosettiformis]
MTATMFPSGLPSPVATPPPLATRQPSEDWVSRTKGLRIDRDHVSPVIEEEFGLAAVSGRQESCSDDMTMDDEPMSGSWSPSGSTPPVRVLSQPSPIRPQPNLNNQDINKPRPSHITIPPMSGFPEQSFSAPYNSDPAPLTPTTPPHSMMAIHPENIALPLSPSKKLRFTMGPRLDCEKCRLRVPGHYSHFN